MKPKVKSKADEMICRSSLKILFGLTDKLIEMLGEPDDSVPNPHYRSAGSPMLLYRRSRVVRWVKRHQADIEAVKSRREAAAKAAAKAVKTKRNELLEYVENVVIEVPEIPETQLIEAACKSYNSYSFQCGRDNENASPSSTPEFLHRICVNYLRHELTRYEGHLQSIKGKVGKEDAYLELKDKVLDAIAEAYPWLWDECQEQSQRSRIKSLMTLP